MDNQNFISYRKTQKGDWLIFNAVPYTKGIGVDQAGSPGVGYTTGTQFDRAGSKAEAEAKAIKVAESLSNDFVQWTVIDWEPPSEFNLQFSDLPKLYPAKKDYDSFGQAEADGWIRINVSKTITWYRGVKIYCRDVTPGNWFGSDLAIVCALDNNKRFAQSSEIWAYINGNQRFSIRFRTGDVVDAIAKAKAFIDSDLITQTEAARVMASLTGNKPLVQSIRNAINQGRLDEYKNDAPTERQLKQRHGLTLVSRSQVKRVWGR